MKLSFLYCLVLFGIECKKFAMAKKNEIVKENLPWQKMIAIFALNVFLFLLQSCLLDPSH